MRRANLLAGIVAVCALLAVPAAGKEGVRATLDHPIRLDGAAGKAIRVAWHLVDAKRRPFGASGIYLRVSRCGRRPMRISATAHARGGYSAHVRMPKGGIRKLLVGLKGVRIVGDRKERADVYFQFDPPLYRDCS
jgi:hypothetical protein